MNIAVSAIQGDVMGPRSGSLGSVIHTGRLANVGVWAVWSRRYIILLPVRMDYFSLWFHGYMLPLHPLFFSIITVDLVGLP